MNDLPRQKLLEIVGRHGKSIVENARRAEGLFRDHFGGYRREIAVLTMAIEEGVARELADASPNAPRAILLARLKQRLIDNLALSEDAAKWAVESWALAFGVISNDDLKIHKTQAAEATNPPVVVSSQNQNSPVKAPIETTAKNSFVVSAAGGGDFVSIGEAVKAAQKGAKISVRPGVYEESLIINKQLEITGEGAVKEIVVRSRNASCVLMQTDRAVIRNLTFECAAGEAGKQFFGIDIQSGELTLQNCDVTSDSLACIAVHGAGTKPLIKDCLIRDGAEGGIYFFDSAAGHLEECEIYRNGSASVVIAQNANPTFKNCRIAAGAGVGFRVYESGLGTLDDCDIFGHAGAEITVTRAGSPVLRGCSVHSSGRSGIDVRGGASVMLENCSIYENQGAGVSIDSASIGAISNCRINGNAKVAVRVKGGSSVRVENSDLRGNLLATWETDSGVFIENNNNLEY